MKNGLTFADGSRFDDGFVLDGFFLDDPPNLSTGQTSGYAVLISGFIDWKRSH